MNIMVFYGQTDGGRAVATVKRARIIVYQEQKQKQTARADECRPYGVRSFATDRCQPSQVEHVDVGACVRMMARPPARRLRGASQVKHLQGSLRGSHCSEWYILAENAVSVHHAGIPTPHMRRQAYIGLLQLLAVALYSFPSYKWRNSRRRESVLCVCTSPPNISAPRA
ncbi:hypothetical protein OH77DRAFT_906453 [Trametes cingulata]|nr:hypothetical protein OH77DRAFT_906453 [Trametes cingulata]